MAFFGRYEIEITIMPLGGLHIKCSFHFKTYIIAIRPRPVLNKLSDRLFIFSSHMSRYWKDLNLSYCFNFPERAP